MKKMTRLYKILALSLLVPLLTTSIVFSRPSAAYALAGSGLCGEYYDNEDFTNLKLTETDPTVNFNWGSGSPDSSIGSDTFSVRWTGQVRPQYTEKYYFYTAISGGVRLWVNGELLIDKWFDQNNAEWKSSINLTANTDYDIRLEYYTNTGNASVSLSWSSPSQSKQIVPQSLLNNEAPLVSSGKTATAEGGVYDSSYAPSYALDSNASTYWKGGSYPKWWKVDLGANYEVKKINIRNYVDGTRYYQYNIQTSTNGTSWTTIASKSSTNPATDEGDTYNISSIGRYVRVNMTYNSANTGTHISEVKVYGLKECTLSQFLLTSDKTAEIEAADYKSDELFTTYGTNPSYALDSDASNGSYASVFPYQHFWQVDLEDNYDIRQIKIRNYVTGSRYYQYVIYASKDKLNWTEVASKNNTNPAVDEGDTYDITGIVGRYIRVLATYNSDNRAFQISDFKAYGFREVLPVPEPSVNRSAFDIIQSSDNNAVNSMTFMDSDDVKYEYRIGKDTNPASATTAGDYLQFDNLEFGSTGANQFIARVCTPKVEDPPIVSLGKNVTAESNTTGHGPEYANDSSRTTYWGGGYYPKWWQVDLGEMYEVRKVNIRNYVDGTRYYKYNIQTSKDGIDWKTVATKSDTNVATDEGDTYEFKSFCRYIRVNITYNSDNQGSHICDLQVYGFKMENVNLEVRLDSPTGTLVGTLPAFKQYQKDSTLACDITNVTGVHTVYLVIGNNSERGLGINWFRFANKPALPIPTPKPASLPAPSSGNYNVYFGNLHSHTAFSDGMDVPDVAYNYAKTTANIDFLAVTDHTNLYDNGLGWDKSIEWRDTKLSAARNTTDGSFVGIAGSETTWYNGIGHMNSFGMDFFINQYETKYNTITEYYNLIKQYPASIHQWNHPWQDDFYGFLPYDADVDKVLYLMEVPAKTRTGQSFESFYIKALDLGWHVAPTGNQDNHEANWGDANTRRSAILAENLTQDYIFDAIRNYRVYSTMDINMKVIYKINGSIMGSILSDPSTLSFSVNVTDPDSGDNISRIEVYTDGGVLAGSADFSSNNVNWTSFSVANNTNKYYFLKVIQADGQYAITAPIWTGK